MTESVWTVPGHEVDLGVSEKQEWVEDDGTFVRVETLGGSFPVLGPEIPLLLARQCRECTGTHVLPLPPNFKFCPNCGQELTSIDEVRGDAPQAPLLENAGWLEAPGYVPTGFADRTKIAIPGGDYGFVVTGSPSRLIAFDYESGRTLRHDGGANWGIVTRGRPSLLKPWQRNLTASQYGFFYGTARDGLGFTATPLMDGTRVGFSSSISGASQAVAGLGMIARTVVVPVLASGSLRLDGCRHEMSPLRGVGAWCSFPIDDHSEREPEHFGRPFANSAGDLFWAGVNTYLVAEVEGPSIKVRRLAWRTGFEALPATRPYRAPSGSLWSLGYLTDDDNQGYAFHRISSAAQEEIQRVSGPHLPFGGGSFRGDKRHAVPWQQEKVDYDPGSDNTVLSPVIAFGGERFIAVQITGREVMSDLVRPEGIDVPAQGRLVTFNQWAGSVQQLAATFQLHAPHDVTAVSCDDQLFVYGRCDNELLSWRMLP